MRVSETESRPPAVTAGSFTAWLTVLVLLASFPVSVHSAVALRYPVVVQGAQWALYDVSSIKGAPFCMPYENSGYSLAVQGVDPVSRRILVHSRPGDLECRAVFPPEPGSIPPAAAAYARSAGSWPELAEISRRLTGSCRTQYQAVNQVLCWVSGAIDYRSGPGVPTHPLEVYRQGVANCVGASELTVALLREAGIPARSVRGFLSSGSAVAFSPGSLSSRELSLGEEGLHRWVEVYFPGAGWVFSDPFRTVNFVSSRYLVFDLEAPPDTDHFPACFQRQRLEISDPESTFIRLLDRGGLVVQTDVLPFLEARAGMAVRRNDAVQYRPAVIGQVVPRCGSGTGQPDEVHLLPAHLATGNEPLVTAVRRGVFFFTGLTEGDYRLRFYRGGEPLGVQRDMVHIPPHRVVALRIELGE